MLFIAIAVLAFPYIISEANASGNMQISSVVIEKDNELLTIDLTLYLQMKSADLQEIMDTTGRPISPSYIIASTGKTFKLNDYFDARSASNDGQISSALQLLDTNAPALAQTITAVELTFENGEFVRSGESFKVIGID